MKETETFIINIRGFTIPSTGRFKININIPNARRYTKFKMFVKDFIIIDSDVPPNEVQPDIYTLNSDTLLIENNYANFDGTDNTLNSGSRILAVVAKKSAYTTSQNEAYFSIPSINGTHIFWVEDFIVGGDVITSDFYVSLVVQGYN